MTTVPTSSALVRLYSNYMYTEYGNLDSDDYVSVNLFAVPLGSPYMTRSRNPQPCYGCLRERLP